MLVRDYKATWLDLTLQYAQVSQRGLLVTTLRTRSDLTPRAPQEFVTEFFDQNPIGQMAIMVTRDGLAERLTPLSGARFLQPPLFGRHFACAEKGFCSDSGRRAHLTGNPADHLKVLQNKKKLEPRGQPSLQNVLQLAKTGLSCVHSSLSALFLLLFSRPPIVTVPTSTDAWRFPPAVSHLPPHGSREVIIILGSLTTCDPTNIHQTIADVEKER